MLGSFASNCKIWNIFFLPFGCILHTLLLVSSLIVTLTKLLINWSYWFEDGVIKSVSNIENVTVSVYFIVLRWCLLSRHLNKISSMLTFWSVHWRRHNQWVDPDRVSSLKLILKETLFVRFKQLSHHWFDMMTYQF